MTESPSTIERGSGSMPPVIPQGRTAAAGPLVLVLGCLLVAPSLLQATQLASSQAVGASLAAMLAFGGGLLAPGRLALVRKLVAGLLIALITVSAHLMLASRFGNVAMGRALGSLVLLTVFAIGGASLAELLLRTPPARLRRLTHNSITLLLVLGAWGCTGMLQPFRATYPKPVFPFTEPSHFALLLTPVLITACAMSSQPRRLIYIGLALAETTILQNLTMAVGCALAALTCLPLRHLLLLVVVAVPASTAVDLSYYTNRIDFADQGNTNVSALVFLQGWQMLDEAWENTQGFGLGFQQLGVNGSEVDAALIIQRLVGDDQNLMDGGFTIAKIVSEFGIFGVALLLTYLFVAIKALWLLRSSLSKTSATPPIALLSASVIWAYLLELAVRGAGYFTPGGLLLFAALVVWRSRGKTQPHKRRARSRRVKPSSAIETARGEHAHQT